MNVEQFLAWRLRSLLALLAGLRGAGKRHDRVLCHPHRRARRQTHGAACHPSVPAGICAETANLDRDGTCPAVSSILKRIAMVRLGADDTAGLLREARKGFDSCFVSSLGVFEVRMEAAAFLSGARDLRGPKFPTAKRTVYSRPYNLWRRA